MDIFVKSSLLLILLSTIHACKSVPEEDYSAAAVTGDPDEGQVLGVILKDADLRASRDMQSPVLCRLKQGTKVLLAKFQNPAWKAYTEKKLPCDQDNPDSKVGWLPRESVQFADSAFEGKLRRVNANSKIAVAMNYAADKIFCTAGKCLINERLYGSDRCYVHPKVFDKIQSAALAVEARFRKIGIEGAKLLMLDCYRPIYVQNRMAELIEDLQNSGVHIENGWVARPMPPNYGGHNGGIAVDVSVADASGKMLDMGSGYDEFSDRSKFGYGGLAKMQKNSRIALREAMVTDSGFKPYDKEWWHFSIDVTAKPLDLAL